MLEFFRRPDPAPSDYISDRSNKLTLHRVLSGAFHKKDPGKATSDLGDAAGRVFDACGEGGLARNTVVGGVDWYGECVRRRRLRTGA